jgi:hypothetical protein
MKNVPEALKEAATVKARIEKTPAAVAAVQE